MAAYNAAPFVPSLEPGAPAFALIVTADAAASGFASQQFALAGAYPRGGARLRFEGVFSAAPGTFEVDVQEAAVDAANNYKTVGSATVVDANQTFGIDVIDGLVGPFVRVLIKTLTNAVTLKLNAVSQ
jgi:hypothetical protein